MEENILKSKDSVTSSADFLYGDTLAEQISEIFERDSRRYNRVLANEQEVKLL